MKKLPQGKTRNNIECAPYEIGALVRITFAADETFNHKFMGSVGVIVYYDYSCGCGQHFPCDPMIGVAFNGGEIEEFWREEIMPLE